MKFITRAEAGLRPPKASSAHPHPLTKVACHWGGGGFGDWPWDHAQCYVRVRGWQDFHMKGRGWNDLAYNFVACPHGYVFEGRGVGAANAANGGIDGDGSGHGDNHEYIAICYLGGQGDPFTAEAKNAFNDAASKAGLEKAPWKGHRDLYGTNCPGEDIIRWVRAGHPRSGSNIEQEGELFKPSNRIQYHITLASNLLLWDLPNRGKNADPIGTYPSDGGEDQRWELVGHTDGSLSIVARGARGEMLAVDVPGGDAKVEKRLQVWDAVWNDNQRFTSRKLREGEVQFIHVKSGLAIDFAHSGPNAGWFQLYTPHDGLNQINRLSRTV